MKKIYLDHAAATPIYPEVLKKITESGTQYWGNTSSIHSEGQNTKKILDEARYECARFFECEIGEVIFTSGATESIHLGIIGNYLSQITKDKTIKNKNVIYVSPIVHSSILGACEYLEKYFEAQIKLLPLDKNGFLDIDKIDEKIFSEARMIITEHGNSEIGLLQPVAKLGKKIMKYRSENETKNTPFFLVDIAASVVTEKVSLRNQICDMLTVSGEKFGAPSGTGVLIKKFKTPLKSLFLGSQEFGFRAGTENWLGILGICEALKLHNKNRVSQREKYKLLHEFTREYFLKKFPKIQIVTPGKKFLPHVFNFILSNENSEFFVQKCDLEGLQISAGSACSSGNVMGSKVLKALGFSDELAKKGVRISFGRTTEIGDLKKAFKIFEKLF